MAGTDDHGAVIGDWAAFNPSPRTFFSSMLGESYLDVYGENGSDGLFAASGKNKMGMEFGGVNDKGNGVSSDSLSEANVLSNQQPSSRGGLTERLAARAGFNAPRLNTSKIRSGTLSSSPDVRSPYLTIPPGLSPTSLLDSPVFLSNSLAQPSPTTGKFSFPTSNNKDSVFEDFDTSSFAFKPHVESSSLFFRGGENKLPPAANHQQSYANIELSIQSEKPLQPPNLQDAESHALSRSTFNPQTDILSSFIDKAVEGGNNNSLLKTSNSVVPSVAHSPPLNDQQDGEGERGNGESSAMTGGGASSEDGYNWRKYGQKVVKGSEYPRSYYKCTHQNCQVKKKVERSHEGHVTEIIYKGAHNHPKPPPNRRSGLGSSNPQSDMQLDIPEHAGAISDPAWTSSQRVGLAGGPDIRHDNLEATSSTSVVPKELCEPSSSIQAKNGSNLENADAVDVSSTVSNDEDEEDRATHGSISLGYDGEGDESESKRRKIDACAMEMTGASRSIREPRVVVQTTSEVDILDDGYRWRKYGQKVVKGNPNPRSYYKCTNAGCTVRKHVERASHDLKSVITTYEGKHNHDVPAARNSSHVNSGPSSTAPPASGGQTHIHRPEPSQIRDRIARFDGPSSLGGSTFNLHGRQHQPQQLGPTPGFSFGMNQSGLANLAMAGLGPGQGKLPGLPIHQYLGQQRAANEAGIMVPKGELKDEHVPDSGLNLSNGSAIYQQFMNRLPISPEW